MGVAMADAGVVQETNPPKRGRGRPRLEVTANRRVAFRVTEAEERLTNEILIKLGYPDAKRFFLVKLLETAENIAPEHEALLREIKKKTAESWELCPDCGELGQLVDIRNNKKQSSYRCSCGSTWRVIDRERQSAEHVNSKLSRYR